MKVIKKNKKKPPDVHPVERVYINSVYDGRSTNKLRLARKDYKITKDNIAKIESESKSLVGEPPNIVTKEAAVKEENVIEVRRYRSIDETVRL